MSATISRLGFLSLAILLPFLGLVHLIQGLGGVEPVAALPTTTFTVSNLNDSGTGSLRQAILNANATAGADVIEITAVGTVNLLSPLPIINEALTILGPGTDQLKVDGGNSFRVFESTAVPLIISDLTVQQGAPASDTGGGIRSLGTLTLTNVAVLSNTSPIGGGGVYVAGESSIVNGRFENNRSLSSLGGGLFTENTAFITGTQFISNTSPGQGGGALVDAYSVLRDVRFEDNRTLFGSGGGLYASGIVTLVNATLISNTAFGDGGGLLAFGQANIYGSHFSDNQCADQGGAMYVGSFLVVQQSSFVDNHGGRGGAVFHNAGTGSFENSLFAQNTATNAGDQLFLNNGSMVTFNYVTAVGSASGMGTGIHIVNSNLVLTNTIVASQTIGLNNVSGSVDHDYLLFWGNGTDIQGSATGGSHNVSGEPRFISFVSDNYHLGAGSAAIDAGTDTGVLVDYDGQQRPLDNGFDIGFDEASPPPLYLPLVLR